ncbi:MAG: M56 family metallopeptidase [Candidatus Omnitrophica bacterium]|nr:M56 family metallopeptidase [Candidatus Omnitrophota bacterium]
MNPIGVPVVGLAWLWRASWQASVLVLLVLLTQWVFRARLTPQWRHALWWLVVIRLILPVAPESPWSIFNLAPLTRLEGGWQPLANPNRTSITPDLGALTRAAIKADSKYLPAFSPAEQRESSLGARLGWLGKLGFEYVYNNLFWFWLLGMGFYAGRLIVGIAGYPGNCVVVNRCVTRLCWPFWRNARSNWAFGGA